MQLILDTLDRFHPHRMFDDIQSLRDDFTEVMGKPFAHFFCPFLYKDQPVELCNGHIINQAFPGADRQTVIQRADVDNFFGSKFEADFVLLAERGEYETIDLLLNGELRRKLRPRLTIDGRPVSFYSPTGPVPEEHSRLAIEMPAGEPIPLALKLQPSETLSSLAGSGRLASKKTFSWLRLFRS